MVKKLVTVVVSSFLALTTAAAAAAPANTGVPQTVEVTGGKFAGIDSAMLKIGQLIDFGGTHIFWVLGIGLIAFSLVARRVSV